MADDLVRVSGDPDQLPGSPNPLRCRPCAARAIPHVRSHLLAGCLLFFAGLHDHERGLGATD